MRKDSVDVNPQPITKNGNLIAPLVQVLTPELTAPAAVDEKIINKKAVTQQQPTEVSKKGTQPDSGEKEGKKSSTSPFLAPPETNKKSVDSSKIKTPSNKNS